MKIKNIVRIIFWSVIVVIAAGYLIIANQRINTDKKILVAYYSYSGNTRSIAEKIHSQIGGDIFEIKPKTSYSDNYDTVVSQVQKEQVDNIKPELLNNVDNINQYDIIILGTPVWWYTMAPPVKTFLSQNNFEGKTVIPFCTHGGGGESKTFEDMKKLAPKAKFLEGFSIYEKGNPSTPIDISDWLKRNIK